MRTFSRKKINAIRLPEDFATLENITPDGFFIYKIRYMLLPGIALTQKAFKVEIVVSEEPYSARNLPQVFNYNPEEIRDGILKRRSIQKDFTRSRRKNRIRRFISDITNQIPNDRLSDLSRDNFQPSVFRRFKSIQPVAVDELDNQNVAAPVLEINKNENKTIELSSREIKALAKDLIINRRTDPAAFVGERSNSIIPARKIYGGLFGRKEPISIRSGRRNGSSLRLERLTRSLLSNVQYSDQIELNEDEFLNVPLLVNQEHALIEKRIKIPIGDLDLDKFYLHFHLRNNRDLKIQTVSGLVDHSKNTQNFRVPFKAPTIRSAPVAQFGRVILRLKQEDPNATAIRVYKKEFNKNQPNLDADYSFVGEVEANFGEDFTRISDISSNINPTIYRAVAINDSGILGGEFNSVVVETTRGIVAKRDPKFKDSYFVSMDYTIDEQKITVNIQDIPTDVIAVELLRTDKSIFQRSPTRIGNIEIISTDSNTPIKFSDVTVKRGRIYEYVTKLHFRTGNTIIASNRLLVEFCPITSNIVNVSTTAPEIQDLGTDVDVSFDIIKDVIETEETRIKDFLETQGFIGEFQDEVIANRDKLNDLFGVSIVRQNLSTGELEEFGVISSETFSDVRFGRPKGVKPLNPGAVYKYILTVFSRDIQTLFSTLQQTENDGELTEYSYKPSKWHHPITLNEGSIVTERSLVKNHSNSTFSFGTVVDILEVNVSLTNLLPDISDAKATQTSEDTVLIQWKLEGDSNKIDHFIIVMEMLGMRTIIGKSHNISNSNYFQYVDKLENEESGGVSYAIIPVYYDFTRGTELKTNQVVI